MKKKAVTISPSQLIEFLDQLDFGQKSKFLGQWFGEQIGGKRSDYFVPRVIVTKFFCLTCSPINSRATIETIGD